MTLPLPQRTSKSTRVPKCEAFDPAGGPMSPGQETFYVRHYLPAIAESRQLDTLGNHGYAERRLHEIEELRKTEPRVAREALEAWQAASRQGAPSLPWPSYLLGIRYLLEDGHFAAAIGTLARRGDLELEVYLSQEEALGHLPVEFRSLVSWTYGSWPKGILKHRGINVLQSNLDAFHAEHGQSIIAEFWQRVTAGGAVEDVVDSVLPDLRDRLGRDDLTYAITHIRSGDLEEFGRAQFQGIDWPAPRVRIDRVGHQLVREFCVALMRRAENQARTNANLPRVGEGLVGEIELLNLIRDSFPGEVVIHQGRLEWLRPQSLDIYLPDRNIGIEYQGIQHSRPVDFFGGKEAFEDQQSRDSRKRHLCESNGMVLVEVHPGYSPGAVVAQVRAVVSPTEM
ncbi:hypothetical protein [Pseudoclavibacter sp. VKM Ac-2867]|uniref:hypothetical protein n=1 Tax=Pseudoclavibacter sp. VKM Ac-2867 TaxID=2783829 RepID=UPI00188A1BE6|nr:hypothetical protein [Pseudoclavibacter sp. VKM Ac-2867]MBF4459509.1 hypothetical protein [Pseudoclavibacter sp. VKM Ac-2867]